MNYVLGGRTIGQVLGHSGGAAAVPWWLYGGVSAANAWAVYQPIGAASLAASYVNLANPGTYDAVPGVAPTFDTATGWTFNGSSQYLKTGITPAGDNTWTMIVKFSGGASIGTRGLAGTNDARNFHIITSLSGLRQYAQPTRYLRKSGVVIAGVMAISGITAYIDGASDGTLVTALSDSTANTIFVGALNNGSANNFWQGSIQAIAIYNTTLSAAQVSAISSAMAAL